MTMENLEAEMGMVDMRLINVKRELFLFIGS